MFTCIDDGLVSYRLLIDDSWQAKDEHLTLRGPQDGIGRLLTNVLCLCNSAYYTKVQMGSAKPSFVRYAICSSRYVSNITLRFGSSSENARSFGDSFVYSGQCVAPSPLGSRVAAKRMR